MAKKSRKERKLAAVKQSAAKQNVGNQDEARQSEKVDVAGEPLMEVSDNKVVEVPKEDGKEPKAVEAVKETAETEKAVEEKTEAEKVAEEKPETKKAVEEKVTEEKPETKEKAEADVKAEEEAKEKIETEVKEETEAETKEKAETEVKAEIETEAKEKEKAETKAKAEAEAQEKAEARRRIYEERFARHLDEMKWLYMELYGNSSMFAELCDNLYRFYEERNDDLKTIDEQREEHPDWYKSNDMLGMMFYIDNFGGNMKGVEARLEYLEKNNVNYIHLMPFLDTVEGRSDGGYAVADFRKVQEKLGTMEDLESLTAACHKKNMNVCMDFVMNHTSEDHEWAKKARQGDGEYMSRYFFYDNYTIPAEYEKTVPQVFPTTAPGNFTWLPDAEHFVMTTFYPYQWDLNYKNPRVFNEMMYNFLFLANKGIDIIRIDAVPYIWKELNTQCRNLKEVHTIVRLMRMISEIVCPSVLLLGEVVMEPEKVVPYFGTVEKPECHMLYNGCKASETAA